MSLDSTSTSDDLCDVCRAEPMVGVAASTMGPISLAYGKECLEKGAEPLWCFEAAFCADSPDELKQTLREGGMAEWAQKLGTYVDGKYVNIMEWARG